MPLPELLPIGRPPIFTVEARNRLGRCMSCEFDPKMQGHDPRCPERDGAQ